MKWPGFFKQSNIGIDLGSRTTKAVQIQKNSGSVAVTGHFFHDAGMTDGFPKMGLKAAELKALAQVAGFSKQKVSSCLDDRDVETCEFVLPEMPKAELIPAVQSEAEQRIHFPVEEAFMDHVVLDRHKDDGTSVLTIKAYVARRDRIKQHLNVLRQADLKPISLETAMLANVAMLDFNDYLTPTDNYVVVDMGEAKTNVALIMQKKAIFINSISSAGGSINKALGEKKGLSYQDAEKLKMSHIDRQEIEDLDVNNIIDEVLLELLNGVQHSVDYFRVYSKDSPISKIFLVGGTSQDPHVVATIEKICQIETVLPNPFKNIDIYSGDQARGEQLARLAPHMATAVGLALRGLDGR